MGRAAHVTSSSASSGFRTGSNPKLPCPALSTRLVTPIILFQRVFEAGHLLFRSEFFRARSRIVSSGRFRLGLIGIVLRVHQAAGWYSALPRSVAEPVGG